MHCRIFGLAAASCAAMLLAACSAELPASPSLLAPSAVDAVSLVAQASRALMPVRP